MATFQILAVQRHGRAVDSRPRIQFCGDWLPELGFVNGALVQALPESDGIVFHLCDENIHYSQLFHQTKALGGTLIRVYITQQNTRNNMPCFVTSGNHIYKSGLQMGDALIAKCEYGCIKIKKISGNVRLVYVAKGKNARTGVQIPAVLLTGAWLHEIGFTPDTLVTVKPEPGCITFAAQNTAIIYSDLVRFARQNRLKLIQVSTKDGSPCINVKQAFVEQCGFHVGDIFVAQQEYGTIKLQKFDPQRFGF